MKPFDRRVPVETIEEYGKGETVARSRVRMSPGLGPPRTGSSPTTRSPARKRDSDPVSPMDGTVETPGRVNRSR